MKNDRQHGNTQSRVEITPDAGNFLDLLPLLIDKDAHGAGEHRVQCDAGCESNQIHLKWGTAIVEGPRIHDCFRHPEGGAGCQTPNAGAAPAQSSARAKMPDEWNRFNAFFEETHRNCEAEGADDVVGPRIQRRVVAAGDQLQNPEWNGENSTNHN